MDTPMNHGEYEELAAGFVLGALEPDDQRDFERHLSGCQDCAANVRQLEAVAGELAYAVPPVAPPDTVWAGIEAEIERETERAAPPQAPAPVPIPRPRSRALRLLGGLAAAAALVLVVALGAWNLRLRDQNDVYRQRVAALERAAQLINEPNARLVALDDAPPPEGARATVIASIGQDRGVLVVENLPPLQRNRVYELWGVPEGDIARAEKALVFIPLRPRGVLVLRFTVPIQPGTVFALTEEPGPTGSDKPTTEPLMVGVPQTA